MRDIDQQLALQTTPRPPPAAGADRLLRRPRHLRGHRHRASPSSATSTPVAWVPGVLGIAGMLMLFYGCVMLLRETRLALRAVDTEMAFVLELNERHRREANGGRPRTSTCALSA